MVHSIAKGETGIMKLVTLPAAAKESGIPYSTLLRLANERLIPVVRIPGRRSALIDPADVAAWIQSLKTGAVPGVVLDIGTVPETEDAPVITSAERSKLPYYERFKPKAPQPLKVRLKA
jgi:hypothetical protein